MRTTRSTLPVQRPQSFSAEDHFSNAFLSLSIHTQSTLRSWFPHCRSHGLRSSSLPSERARAPSGMEKFMYIVVHALCALLYIAVSACLHGDMVWYSFVMSPALRRSQLKWSGSRKEQTANQSAPGFPEEAGLRLGDHPSSTIPSHRYDPGFGSRRIWASFVSCLLVVAVGMLTFPSSTSYSSDGSWNLGVKVKSPFSHIPVGTFPLQTQRLR